MNALNFIFISLYHFFLSILKDSKISNANVAIYFILLINIRLLGVDKNGFET
jgi:hypothetical protein